MESGLTTTYGPIEVNVYNFLSHTSSFDCYTDEAYSIKVNDINCAQEVYANVYGHNAKARGTLVDLYRVKFALCDLLSTLKGKSMKGLVNIDVEQLIEMTASEWEEIKFVDQVDALQWIMLGSPLYEV